MRKIIFIPTLLTLYASSLYSQVEINNEAPQASLDIQESQAVASNTPDGILVPRH